MTCPVKIPSYRREGGAAGNGRKGNPWVLGASEGISLCFPTLQHSPLPWGTAEGLRSRNPPQGSPRHRRMGWGDCDSHVDLWSKGHFFGRKSEIWERVVLQGNEKFYVHIWRQKWELWLTCVFAPPLYPQANKR